MTNNMKLIVWLWNPWEQYKNTRHNIWFTMLDEFVNSNNLWSFSYDNKYGWETFTTLLNWEKVAFLKPMEYMNKSGWPVSKLANFYKIEPKDILVIHDEIDLPVGTVKLKFGWWLAGHNWLRDIALKLWTQDFWRVRIWVDRPNNLIPPTPLYKGGNNSVADYVLWTFRKEQIETIKDKYLDIEKFVFEFLEK